VWVFEVCKNTFALETPLNIIIIYGYKVKTHKEFGNSNFEIGESVSILTQPLICSTTVGNWLYVIRRVAYVPLFLYLRTCIESDVV